MERSNWRRRSRAELLWERAEGKREMAHFPRCQLNRVEWLAVNKKTPTIYSATFVPSVISRLWFLVFTEPLWFYAAVLLFPAETPYSVTRSLLCTSFFPFFLSTVDIKSITQVWVCFTLEHYWVSVLVRHTLPWFSSEFQSYFKAHKPTVTFSYSCSQTFFATLPSRNKKSSYSRAPTFLIPIIKKKKKKKCKLNFSETKVSKRVSANSCFVFLWIHSILFHSIFFLLVVHTPTAVALCQALGLRTTKLKCKQ